VTDRRRERVRVVLDASPLRDARRDAGIGRYVAQLIEALRAIQDLDLRLASPRGSGPDSWVKRFLYAQPTVIRRAVTSRAELVHAMASDPVLGWPTSRQVVTVHDVAPWTTHLPPEGTYTRRYLDFQRPRFARCAAVIAVSEIVADETAAVLAVPRAKITVVPEGVAEGFSERAAGTDAAARARAGASEAGYLLWVGSLRSHDPRKAIDDLVAAVAALGPAAPPLVLAGRTGEEAGRIGRLASEAGVPVVMPGYVDDATLAALYRGAGVVAVPSRHEGFGLTALEAMACGAPVVASTGGNLSALGDAAVLVEPGDRASLGRAIRSVLDDPALAMRLRTAGPAYASKFSWGRAAHQTAEVYRRIRSRR